MNAKWKYVLVVIVASAFNLFGTAGAVRADAITVGSATQVMSGGLQIQGTGTFSVDQGRRLASMNPIQMIVKDSTGKVVSTTQGTIPQGTTEWGSISTTLSKGTYTVTAQISTVEMQGNNPMTIQSQNSIQVTLK